MSFNFEQPITVRLEYGGMRFENDGTLVTAGDILCRMTKSHGIGSLKMSKSGVAVGKVELTGQRAVATLIVHQPQEV